MLWEVRSIKGKIVKNVSNIYVISSDRQEFEAVARGKLKNQDIKPVVGDDVEFERDSVGNKMIINEILERRNFLKRPKVSNISQIIFVIAPKMPITNFVLLDKELCLAEFLGIHPIIVVNKVDLDASEADRISNIYLQTGYKVIKTNAEKEERI